MRFTTSLLADAATLANGKLYVLGGAWDGITATIFPMVQPSIAVVLVIEFDPDEVNPAEFNLHDFEIRLVDEEDIPVGPATTGRFELRDSFDAVPGVPIRQPIAITFASVQFQRAGKYRFAVLVNGTEVHSLSFSVRLV